MERDALDPCGVPHGEDECEKTELQNDRVAPAHRRGDDFVEARTVLGTDDSLLYEECHGRPEPFVNDLLGQNEQGERHEEADLRVQILQEGNPDSAERPSLEQGDDEERQPGEKDARADTPIEEIESRPHQAGSQEELVERTTQGAEVPVDRKDREANLPTTEDEVYRVRAGDEREGQAQDTRLG